MILAPLSGNATEVIDKKEPSIYSKKNLTSEQVRNKVIRFVRKKAEYALLSKSLKPDGLLQVDGNWHVNLSLYHEGTPKWEGMADANSLNKALGKSVMKALKGKEPSPLTLSILKQARFLVSLEHVEKKQQFSIIEYKGEGKELIGDLVPIRKLDRSLLHSQIFLSMRYLLHIMHPEKYGFSKKYDIQKGGFDNLVRTIYTASSLYTILKINKMQKDPEVEKNIQPIGDFILSMQKQDDPYRGAFYYSYDIIAQEKELRFPVGTTAKTIMTLLKLHEKYKDKRYIDAAKLAGSWILTMQLPDGTVAVDAAWRDGKWDSNKNFSLFYNGQVLTSLSRLYKATNEKQYYEGAEKIAKRFFEMIKAEGYFLRDDYLPKVRTISTSWLAMSLLDFNSIKPYKTTEDIIFRCMDAIVSHQMTDPDDIYNYGRFDDTKATSGNGWINEVMAKIYKACINSKRQGCGKYKKSLTLTSRWLIQNTYSEENTYHLKNPEKVIGGLIRNDKEEAIRTDAVCHGVNSLIGLWEFTEEGVLLEVNESKLPL
jgi:hypothetical protein